MGPEAPFRQALIRMKYLFHIRPPFPFRAGFQGLLHGHHNVPPFLSLGIGGHSGHIGLKVVAHVLEVGEEIAVLMVDGVDMDIAHKIKMEATTDLNAKD